MSQNNPTAHAFKEGNVFHTYVTIAGQCRPLMFKLHYK